MTKQRSIKASPNKSKRTFTLRIEYKDGSKVKYRTLKMLKIEFEHAEMNTENDWFNYLKYGNYYEV